MKLSGWVFMLLVWASIISLMIFCFSKIFKQGLDKKYKGTRKTKNI